MGIATGISWTGEDGSTWNPWQGCTKVSAGCKNCYMYRDLTRYGKDPKTVVRSSDKTFKYPVTWWRTNAKRPGSMIFPCSWSDFFIPEADLWRPEAWNIIHNTPYIYLILTKRPTLIRDRLPLDWGDTGYPNVYLGVSVEQTGYEGRIGELSLIPCEKRFVSYEPALSAINIPYKYIADRSIDWMITGGESGPMSRQMPVAGVLAVIYQCIRYRIPVFHKQNGGNVKLNGVWGGDEILPGKRYHEFPAISERTKEFIDSFQVEKIAS